MNPEMHCCACGRDSVDKQPSPTRKAPHAAASTSIPRFNNKTACRCAGISLCNSAGLGAFMLRMPRVIRDAASPWYAYLQLVYSQVALPLPIDMSAFEAFYPALLPTASCTLASHLRRHATSSHQSSPTCSALYCDTWLTGAEPSAAAVTAFIANRSYIRVAARSAHDARAFGHLVALQVPPEMRRPIGQTRWGPRVGSSSREAAAATSAAPAPSTLLRRGAQQAIRRHSPPPPPSLPQGPAKSSSQASSGVWIEVTRSIYPGEGTNNYGCWLHQVVGSGVFVRLDVRTTLSWAHRGVSWAAVVAWSHHVPGGRNHDGDLPALAAARGWTAFEILSSHRRPVGWQELGQTAEPMRELVLMDSVCMRGGPLMTGCLPGSLPTRTGWRAVRKCNCDGERYPEVLNCARGVLGSR